jgi:MEMO1 family protein
MLTENQNPDLIRRSSFAGSFYPSDPVVLTKQIEQMLALAELPVDCDQVLGIVSPHAGYMYSGGCAAFGFKAIQRRKYDVVVVISPSHQMFFDSVSVFNGGGYETPLGVIYVDLELAKQIGNVHPKVTLSSSGHAGGRAPEHALEVQLPFLQKMLGDFKLVPIVMGNQEQDIAIALGEVLASKLKDRNPLIVASSDLSHYNQADRAQKMDKGVVDAIEKFDWKLLQDRTAGGASQACGSGPIVSCMYAAKRLGANRARVVQYTHSGMITGDNSEVVGYLSAILDRK